MLLFGSLLLVGLYYLWVRPVLNKDFASTKPTGVATVIFEDHYVVVGQLVTVYGFVDFSNVTKAFLTGIQYIAKPFSAAYGVGCLVTSVNALDELTLFFALPFVVSGLVLVYYAVKRAQISKGGAPELTVARLKVNCIGFLFKSFPTLLTYLLTKAVAVLRPCHQVGVSSYMFADYSVECDDDYEAAQSLATAALVLVVALVGGTLAGMTVHVRGLAVPTIKRPQAPLRVPAVDPPRRPSLFEASTAADAGVWAQAFAFLSEHYADGYWYWRFVDFGRLVLLTSVIELIAPETVAQLSAAIIFSLMFLQLQSTYPPFKTAGAGSTSRNNLFYKYALMSIVAALTFIVLVLSGSLHAKLHELGYLSAELNQEALHASTDVGIIVSVLLPYIAMLRVASKAGWGKRTTAEAEGPTAFENPAYERSADPRTLDGDHTEPPGAGYLSVVTARTDSGAGFGFAAGHTAAPADRTTAEDAEVFDDFDEEEL